MVVRSDLPLERTTQAAGWGLGRKGPTGRGGPVDGSAMGHHGRDGFGNIIQGTKMYIKSYQRASGWLCRMST